MPGRVGFVVLACICTPPCSPPVFEIPRSPVLLFALILKALSVAWGFSAQRDLCRSNSGSAWAVPIEGESKASTCIPHLHRLPSRPWSNVGFTDLVGTGSLHGPSDVTTVTPDPGSQHDII
jgi:hypothetical protein